MNLFDELINVLADVCGVSEEKMKKQDRIAELMVEKEKKFPELPDAVIEFLEGYGEDKAEGFKADVEKPKTEIAYPKYVVDSIDLRTVEDGCYGICDLEEYDWCKSNTIRVRKVFKKLGSKIEYLDDNLEATGFDYVDTCAEKDGYLKVVATYSYNMLNPKGLLNDPFNSFVTAMTKDFYEVR